MQWTSEATRPSHHGSSITACAAPRSEATGLSGRTLRRHGQLQRPQRAPPLRPPASLSSLVPARGPFPALLGRAGGRLLSRGGCGAPSPLLAGPGATWSCARTCRISIFPFAKVAEKVAVAASSPEAGAPAAATGSPSPTPPPPPSLCPAPTSCPRAGAKLTHPSPGVGGCGRRAPPRAEPAAPSRACTRRAPHGALPAPDGRPRSPLAPAAAAPLRALGPAAARSLRAAGGLPPSLGELGAGPRACAAGPAPRGAGGWELEFFFRQRWLRFLPAVLPRPGGELPLTFAEPPGGLLGTLPAHSGAQGPRRHLRAAHVKRAGGKHPESSVSRVRCSSRVYVRSTCFFFLVLSCPVLGR